MAESFPEEKKDGTIAGVVELTLGVATAAVGGCEGEREIVICSPTKEVQPLAIATVSLREGEWEWEIVTSEATKEVEQRIEMIQKIITAQGTERYGKVQEQAAKQLGISVRSLQRLVKRWREQGLTGLSRQQRHDQGAVRISSEWQDFIVKTYREGNCGSCRMSRAQVALRVRARAAEMGVEGYPSRTTVYQILQSEIEKQQRKRSLGWRGDRLMITTREGIELAVEWSNQVWQCDHTKIDVLVVGQAGEVLGRPWLTLVVDSYSRCVMGMHLGFDAPSAEVVGLALRHAILPKQYPAVYEMQRVWETYGIPQYLYTDGGKDFRSQHLEQVATELGIVLCLRRKPSDGGIVERPFGTFNREFFCRLPGYVSSDVLSRSPAAESEASLTIGQLERLLVRYVVDHYNQMLDARMGNQSRIGRWEAGRKAQLPLLGERELDICLMRRDRRSVYRNGYIQFANLTYQGEHLAAYAGEAMILRYDPRDITTVWVYQHQAGKEVFLTRAHAQGLETENLSYAEAQAISRRIREAGRAISNQTVLNEVRDREAAIDTVQRQRKQKKSGIDKARAMAQPKAETEVEKQSDKSEQLTMSVQSEMLMQATTMTSSINTPEQSDCETVKPKKPVPYVRVYENYEQIRREANQP